MSGLNQNQCPIFVRSCPDNVLLGDRVLQNLLESENVYFKLNSPKLEKEEWKLVTEWMLEVCQVISNCKSNTVFISGVQYFDKVVSSMNIQKSQLQLLASACLCIASKLFDPHPFSLQDFVRLTDTSVTMSQLQNMELLILKAIRWELSSPISLNFMPFIFEKVKLQLTAEINIIQEQVETFLVLATTDSYYASLRPSVQAVLAITVAIQMSRTKTVKEPRLTCDKKSCESCTETSIMSNIAGSVNLASYDMTQLVHQFTNSVENWMKIAGVTNNNQHVVSL